MTLHKLFTILFLGLAMVLSHTESLAQRPGGVRIPTDTTGTSKEDTVQYGPKTSQYIVEADLKNNRVRYQPVDTTLTGVHQFSRVENFLNYQQYLGTLGMASRPIYPTVPKTIGTDIGLDAYDIYVTEPEDVRYYDTKSPFTQMYIAFGGQGRDMVDVTFSRNIGPNLNFGFNVRTLSVDKQVGSSRRQGDKVVRSSSINVFTHYRSEDKKYQLMANATRFGHTVFESGGIIEDTTPDTGLSEFFRGQSTPVWLTGFEGKEFRFNYHLYHQYELSELLQVYHEFDRRHQNNFFYYQLGTDVIDTDSATQYFQRVLIDTTQTADRVDYDVWDNEIGLKGSLGNLFYAVHYRIRRPIVHYNNYELDSTLVLPVYGVSRVADQAATELYGGFDLRLDLGENTYLGGGIDYLNTQSYQLEAEFNNPILKAKFVRARVLPTYTDRQFVGNHNYWYESFDPTAIDQLSGSIEYQFPNIYLRPFATLSNINRHIYYQRDTVANSRQAYPVQAGGAAQLLSPGVELHLDFLKKLHFRGQAIYTLKSGRAADVFPVPELTAFGRLYYENIFLDGKIILQIGTDIHYTSSYLGYDYDVATQQFFLQPNGEDNLGLLGNFSLPYGRQSYPVADLFVNLKVRTARLFIRMPQVNQGFLSDGYFTAPFYTGQSRVLDLGIKWQFFD
uniref:Porin n=1 Tax=Roseihalotalea indica TaxID=2867963 RepID=A0AA49JH68_9BACT|nr:putative porin [Tunicatimonas sp. TK19036]